MPRMRVLGLGCGRRLGCRCTVEAGLVIHWMGISMSDLRVEMRIWESGTCCYCYSIRRLVLSERVHTLVRRAYVVLVLQGRLRGRCLMMVARVIEKVKVSHLLVSVGGMMMKRVACAGGGMERVW
jgi:hypothetical protein